MTIDQAVIKWGQSKLPDRWRDDPTLHVEEVTFGVVYGDYGDHCSAAIVVSGYFDRMVQVGRKPRNKPAIMAPEKFYFEHEVEELPSPGQVYREIACILQGWS